MRLRLLDRIRDPAPLVAVELRPPRAALEQGLSMDAWMSMHRAVRRLLAGDTALFLTDNAVGAREEENLHHVAANLEGEVPFDRICPFLTTKHSLEYCIWFADRAVARGHGAITVLGGDRSVGAPRCLPHAYLLRRRIRERHPRVALGGWANPQRDAATQVGHLLDPDATADFFLTQVVSHLDLAPVDAFLAESRRRGLDLPGLFGVFYYRSANPATLAQLARFLPVPAEGIAREFASGLDPDAICARTLRALLDRGVRRFYVSNLRPDDAPERLAAIRRLAGI